MAYASQPNSVAVQWEIYRYLQLQERYLRVYLVIAFPNPPLSFSTETNYTQSTDPEPSQGKTHSINSPPPSLGFLVLLYRVSLATLGVWNL